MAGTKWQFLILLFGNILFSTYGLSLTTYLDFSDIARIKSVIELPTDLSSVSLANIYYSLHAETLLSHTGSIQSGNVDKICRHLQTNINDQLENIYFATSAAKLLPKCQMSSEHAVTAESYVRDDSTALDVYRASFSLLNLGRKLDSTRLGKTLLGLIKDEPLNAGLAFQVAANFDKVEDRNVFVEKIPDVIVQADEVDGKYLQFEGGLGVTANIILGIYQLSTASNKPPDGLTNEHALKFANYFLSRKFVLTQKGISELLQVLRLYTNNKYHIPVCITNFGPVSISTFNAFMSLKITNVFGSPFAPLSVVADSATRVEDKKVVWTKKTLQPVIGGDKTVYNLNLLETKSPRGFYEISISATPAKPDPRLIGNTGVIIKAVISTQVEIVNAEITVADRDSTGTGSVTKLSHPTTFTSQLDADYQQRLLFKFQLRDRVSKDYLTAHQTFFRFTNLKTKRETIFVAEPDSILVYKLDLNLQTKAKDLYYDSGAYQITLIIGDPVISNPLEWKAIANINLHFPATVIPVPPKESHINTHYTPKPEIHHIFREQEKRPHPIVSNAFSILVLVPLLILFALWFKIGVNVSSFPLSLSAIIFHVGLGLIFSLYVCFFVHLNMFQTCKYLFIIGGVTFIAGRYLLNGIANTKN